MACAFTDNATYALFWLLILLYFLLYFCNIFGLKIVLFFDVGPVISGLGKIWFKRGVSVVSGLGPPVFQ